jgi:hypothetical protein
MRVASSADVEPLKQNQYGAASGPSGPTAFSLTAERFRNRQGVTRSAGRRRTAGRSRAASLIFQPVACLFRADHSGSAAEFGVLGVLQRYIPLGNVSPLVYRTTVVTQ